jgi:hypothetical protein
MQMSREHIIQCVQKHCHNIDIDKINVPSFFTVSTDRQFLVHSSDVIFDNYNNTGILSTFNESYKMMLSSIQDIQTFNQEEMYRVCMEIFKIMFDYRLLTTGTGFESRFKTPERMSQKLSSFWYERRINKMTVPAENYSYDQHQFNLDTIPVSLAYNIIMNEDSVGIQHSIHLPTKISSKILNNIENQQLFIDFKKHNDKFYYNISFAVVNDNKKITLSNNAKKFDNFDDFLTDLSYILSREIFNLNYKHRFEEISGSSISFEEFDVSSINTLFDMVKI